ncbi:alpha/beta hydrolase [Acinetobacter bereziniae]|uniref:alpha/beta hydrolase n=1 Tax=Acinetobacter bereziniae TaxID=106648 RepID=UPI001250BB1F|nr:alpha/beta fold hydrolase [Acinetobacter bereziniae]
MIKDHSFFIQGNRTGVLFIHGLTGTPNEMRSIAKPCQQKGYSVLAAQLAGHCGTMEDLVATQWEDWYASVCAAADQLKQHTDEIFVVGLSMGSLLALKYASEHTVAGVVCYSPTFKFDGWSIPQWSKVLAPIVLPVVSHLNIFKDRAFDETEPYGIKNVQLRTRIVEAMKSNDSSKAGLPGNPWHSLYQMQRLSRNVRLSLSKITAPTLCFHAFNDDIADKKNSQLIYDKVSGHKQLIWLYESYHMITIDNDRKQVIEESLNFIQRHRQSFSNVNVTQQSSTGNSLSFQTQQGELA